DVAWKTSRRSARSCESVPPPSSEIGFWKPPYGGTAASSATALSAAAGSKAMRPQAVVTTIAAYRKRGAAASGSHARATDRVELLPDRIAIHVAQLGHDLVRVRRVDARVADIGGEQDAGEREHRVAVRGPAMRAQLRLEVGEGVGRRSELV